MRKVDTKVVDNIELVYVLSGNRVSFSVESKIKLVEYYLDLKIFGEKSDFLRRLVAVIPELKFKGAKTLFNTWCNHYTNGLLRVDNAFTISHQPKKRVTITLDDKIEEKQGYIAKLLADIEGFKRDIEVLKKAKELMGV